MTKRVTAACPICKRFKVKATQHLTAPVPGDQITETPPCETVGANFVGPLYVKKKNTVERPYIALFTCAVTLVSLENGVFNGIRICPCHEHTIHHSKKEDDLALFVDDKMPCQICKIGMVEETDLLDPVLCAHRRGQY